MGFLSGLGRMIQGKPVFQDSDVAGAPLQVPTAQDSNVVTTTDENGQKIIPTIKLDHIKSAVNGDRMEVTAWITNESPLDIELDKMTMLKQRTEIDRRLAPQQAHQVYLYRGPLRDDEAERRAELQYKIVHNGDYFCAFYTIRYQIQSDGRFVVEYLIPERDIRDI